MKLKLYIIIIILVTVAIGQTICLHLNYTCRNSTAQNAEGVDTFHAVYVNVYLDGKVKVSFEMS